MKVNRTDFNNSLLDYGFKDYQIKAIQKRMDEHIYPQIEAIPIEPPVKPANSGVDMDNCFYCGQRASELTQIRVAIKPPNTPNRWKVIGVACNTCNDKFISQIDPSRLSV